MNPINSMWINSTWINNANLSLVCKLAIAYTSQMSISISSDNWS